MQRAFSYLNDSFHDLFPTKNYLNSLLTLLGLAAIINGWNRYTESLPKPTEDDQVTRTDYISGNYKRDLEERRELIEKNRMRGRLFVMVGTSLVLTGAVMISKTLVSEDLQNGD